MKDVGGVKKYMKELDDAMYSWYSRFTHKKLSENHYQQEM